MAENTLETRILLRYATYSQWMNSDVILMPGEAAVAAFPNKKTIAGSNDEPANTPPALGIKIGDGRHYFYELPWVQAIAADVYTWAKSNTKPTYAAYEIQGLAAYIQQYASSSGAGDGTVAPRIYQITRGTGEHINKYYLQYKESTEEDEWITDLAHYIDVDDFVKLVRWIGNDVDNFASLGNRTEDHIQYDLARLSYTDSQQGNYVVTAVAQTNGKIAVTKRELTIDNISGTISVARGGTGKTELREGEVLIGNGANPVLQIPIDTQVAANNNLVRNYAIKAYVDSAVAGLEGAMHFIGDATVEPRGGTDPRVAEYNFANAKPGDVVLWEQKEYVWTGAVWRLLGDEGSYAVKGSIKDADIDAEADIQQSKILNLVETLAEKVDKEEGKVLSSNDYTNEDKIKLANIEERAQVNIIEHILLNGTEAQPRTVNNVDKTVELNISEFDSESREKLASIEEGAQVNTINSLSLNGTALEPDLNHNVDIAINEFTDEEKHKLEQIEEGAQVNKIDTLYINNRQAVPNQDGRLDLTIREYPQEDEQKLATVETGAQVNVIERIKVDGTEVVVDQNKVATITTNPHTEHINKIEAIVINGTEYPPDNNKTVNITLNGSNLDVVTGAVVPDGQGGTEAVNIVNKQLQLAAIAKSGDVKHLLQTQDTYILLNCGSSTDVI